MSKGVDEPFEIFSNIGYTLAGLIPYVINPTIDNLIVAIGLSTLSVGSYIYHKYFISNSAIYTFDWFGMIVALGLNIGVLWNNYYVWLSVLLYIFIYGYFIMGKTKNVTIEVGIIALPLLISLFIFKELWSAIWISLTFGVALAVREIDAHKNTKHVVYDSKFHAAWHILTSKGFLLIRLLK
jgi:hypothetical protein